MYICIISSIMATKAISEKGNTLLATGLLHAILKRVGAQLH